MHLIVLINDSESEHPCKARLKIYKPFLALEDAKSDHGMAVKERKFFISRYRETGYCANDKVSRNGREQLFWVS